MQHGEPRAHDYDGVPTRVMSAEHLMANALQTGRAKDHARLVAFVEAGVADAARLGDILGQHGLRELWQRLKSPYTAIRANRDYHICPCASAFLGRG